jgi:hypothetical protein
VALAVDADEPGLQAAALKTLAAFKHKYLVQVGLHPDDTQYSTLHIE